MLQRLLALRPLLFHACAPSEFESIRRDRAIRAPSTGPDAPDPAVARGGPVPVCIDFWPGGSHGPIAAGRDHIAQQRPRPLRILRARFTAVLQRNPARECNVTLVGVAASHERPGRAAPDRERGVCSIHAGPWSATDVERVSFVSFIDLPLDTVWADSLAGPWQPL